MVRDKQQPGQPTTIDQESGGEMERKIKEFKAIVNDKFDQERFPDGNFTEGVRAILENAVKSVFGQSKDIEIVITEESYLDDSDNKRWESAVVIEGEKVLTYFRDAKKMEKPMWSDRTSQIQQRHNVSPRSPNPLREVFKKILSKV